MTVNLTEYRPVDTGIFGLLRLRMYDIQSVYVVLPIDTPGGRGRTINTSLSLLVVED